MPDPAWTDLLVDPGLLWVVGVVLALLGGGAWVRRTRVPKREDPSATTLPADSKARPAAPTTAVDRLFAGLARTRGALAGALDRLRAGSVDAAALDGLEEALLRADVGVPTTTRLLDSVRRTLVGGSADGEALAGALRAEARKLLGPCDLPLRVPEGPGPFVILVVGVNGSGKTTTIGKLAARLGSQGHRVLLAAADTYRAAAAEQLTIWAERAGAQIVRHDEGADPGAVAFDALDAAAARGCDVVIVDTAGRLQTLKPLMEQLSKIRRVIEKKVPGGPHATLLVLDGTVGQNALSQASSFHAATPITGVALTKLDGTAKGGVILALAAELGLSVQLVGLGEGVDDLRDFDADAFVAALF